MWGNEPRLGNEANFRADEAIDHALAALADPARWAAGDAGPGARVASQTLPRLRAAMADVVGSADETGAPAIGIGAAAPGIADPVALPGARWTSRGTGAVGADIGGAAVAANGARRADAPAGGRDAARGSTRFARSTTLSADGTEDLR
jgi:hypothetical protein